MFPPKILILGAGEGQVPLIQRAKSAGCYVIVVSPHGDYPGFAYADECAYADLSDTERILDVAKKLQIHAIATDQTDISVSSVQYIAQALDLPCIKCNNIDNFRYKSLMREICQKNGIPTIRFCSTNDVNEAICFYNSLSAHKAILKPVDSQGSRGVTVVQTPTELYEAFSIAQKYSKSKDVIIEQFIEGQEIEIDTVVKDGKSIATLIGDVHTFKSLKTFSSFERIYPTQIFGINEQKKLQLINDNIIKVLGLHTGWTHAEYIVTKNAEVYLLEIGARGGGNFVGSDVLKCMFHIGSDEMSLKTSLDDTSFYNSIALGNKYCACKSFYLPEGYVDKININRQFLNSPFILNHNLSSLYIGMKTTKNTDKTSRYTIVVEAESSEKLRNILDQIPQQIDIQVNQGGNLQSIIWE